MIIDTITIVACILIILSVVVSVLANPFVREIFSKDSNTDTSTDIDKLPKISVLVLANNNAEALDAHLSVILTQDYAPGFEVIVVGENGDIATETVIKQYSHAHNLYATYIPAHSLFMSKKKLAVALGVKAAHNEWIVMINSDCCPSSDLWLTSIANHMKDDSNLVIGYSNFNENTANMSRFERLRNDCYIFRFARKSTAYRSNGTNIAFRRSEFISQDGYRGNLQHVGGEYDFIINKFARPNQTQIATERNAWILEDKPSYKSMYDRNISYAHVRRFLNRSLSMRAIFNTDMFLLHFNYIFLIAGLTYSILMNKWLILSCAVVGLIATLIFRTIIAKKVCQKYDIKISLWQPICYELALLWHIFVIRINYERADKRDFTTHKL